MPKKYVYLLILFAVAVLLLPSIQPALALEVTYPAIPAIGGGGSVTINGNSTLLDYVQYFFTFAIALVGIVAVISVVISGFQILLYAGSAEKISEAKERLLGSALGVILLFASFILIRTINPALVNPNVNGLPGQELTGVILVTDYTQRREADGSLTNLPAGDPNRFTMITAPQEIPNLPRPLPDVTFPSGRTYIGATASQSIRYKCTPPTNGIKGPALLVWRFSLPDFEIDRAKNGVVNPNTNYSAGEVDTILLECNTDPGNIVGITYSKSYQWRIEEPGVYFYLNDDCKGISSYVQTTPGSIPWFDGQENEEQTPRSMRITNSRQQQFGVILNQEASRPDGMCSTPFVFNNIPAGNLLLTARNNNNCFDITPNQLGFISDPQYAYIFRHVPVPAGGQVKLESQTLYVKVKATDFNGGFNERVWRLPSVYGGNLNNWFDAARDNQFHQLNPAIARPDPDDECKNPNEPCLKFTKSTGGSFMIILYAANETNLTDDVCQVYTAPENNFSSGGVGGALIGFIQANSNRWIFNSQRVLYDMFIIPMLAN